MKLSKNSKQLMLFFTKNKHINNVKQSKRTDIILNELYNDILNAYKYLTNLKQKGQYYTVTTKKVLTASQISKPQTFNSNSFPELVRKHIDELTMSELTYHFSLYGRNIKVHFIVENDNVELELETYNKHVDSIIMWLYILNQYASKKCANTLVIYLYFTSLEKKIPNSNIFILDEINVNTAFTTTCPKDSEIVVFRKEEWFKVFIHETFHNFALDFSDMNVSKVHDKILKIFPVNSEVNLFESYTEFWAEIMNTVFCSYYTLKNKKDFDEFLCNFDFFINFERTYGFFQMTKALKFMGLTYDDLYSSNNKSHSLRKSLYREKSNVLSYYVIRVILLNNYQGFLQWCKKNNLSLMQFKKTPVNLESFYKFIEDNYNKKDMLEGVDTSQNLLSSFKNKKGDEFILNNMRMTISELG
jgi:hypothetical protein